MHSIKLFLFTVLMVVALPVSAFAQETDDSDEAPVASAAELSVCLSAIEAERGRLEGDAASCDADALAVVRSACAGQETQAIEHFRRLMEMCGMRMEGLETLPQILEAIDCAEPASPPPEWRRREGCAEPASPPPTEPTPPTSAPPATTPTATYVCVDSATPVTRRGRTIRCDCHEGLREVRVDYRTVRQELGHPNGVVVVSCSNPNPSAERIRREEIERIVERIERLETICTDGEGRHTASADEPLLCRTIWMLIERVAANGASITVLGDRLTELEPRVERIEIQLADECGVSVETWQEMSREERAACRGQSSEEAPSPHHFRFSLGVDTMLRTEAAVFSGYGAVRAEYEYDFDSTVALLVSAEGGYGSFGDQPGQIRNVAVGESAYFGIGAGIGLRLDPVWQVGLQLTYRHLLNPGPIAPGELEGDWVGATFTGDVSVRANIHPNFFVELGVGIGGGWIFRESQGRPVTVAGFTLQPRLGIGVSF